MVLVIVVAFLVVSYWLSDQRDNRQAFEDYCTDGSGLVVKLGIGREKCRFPDHEEAYDFKKDYLNDEEE